jgi:hypothetical protein
MKQFAKMFFLVALVLLVSCMLAVAQSDVARVIGTVTDQTGAAVPGATITVTNVDTNRVVSVQSHNDGAYVVNALPIGTYKVEAKKEAFKAETAKVTLEISEVKEVNFKLQVGSTTESVNVTDEVPLVDTATSSAGEIIQGRQVVDLPLNGRNFTSLALMTPGVSRGSYSDQATGSNNQAETWRGSESGGGALVVNGLRPQANNYLLDGLDDNESLVNTLIIFPTVEDISEFKVTTSVAQAEFGRSGGAVVQVATKQGSNSIHGSGYLFDRSRVAMAEPYNWGDTTPSPTLKRNQFGASLGGPIWKNHVFGFVDYQGWRQQSPQSDGLTHVPTALMRQGNFTELYSATGGAHGTTLPNPNLPQCAVAGIANPNSPDAAAFNSSYGYVFNPNTCLPFGWDTVAHAPGASINIIPTQNQNTVGANLLNAFPLPNAPYNWLTGNPSNVANSGNYQPHRKQKKNLDDYDARLDFVLTPKETIFARYSLGDDLLTVTDRLVDANHDLPSGYGSGSNPQRPRQLALGYTRTLTDRMINEFHYGYSRPYFGYQQPGFGDTQAANLGIPNANTSPLLGGMPAITSSRNMEYVGDGGPYAVSQSTNQFTDSLSLIHNRHTFKLGFSLIHRDVDFAQGNNAKGNFCLTAIDGWCWPASSPVDGTFTGHSVAEALAGFMWDYTIGVFNGYYRTRSWENGFFAQDDWRVNRKLTMNLGMRYDVLTWPTEQSGKQSNFDPTTGTLVLPGEAGWPKSLINTPHGDFGPRIGFAYDLKGDGKMIVRGGYGLFYYVDRGGVGTQLSNNPDFNGSQTYYACPGGTAAGCADTSNAYRIALSGAAPIASNDPTVATGGLPVGQVTVNPKALTSSQNVIYYPKNSPNPNIQQYNVQIERALTSATALEVAYVGTHMQHLATSFNANTQILGGTTTWFSNVGQINEYGMIGTGHYNGLQTRLNHKMHNGLQATIAYTLSSTRDNVSGALSSGASALNIGANGKPLLNYNEGRSNSDQRNLFVATALYELPFGRGKKYGSSMPKALDYIAGGWQWNNVVTLTSGTPFDISSGAERPDYHGGCKTDYSSSLWFYCPEGALTLPAGLVGTLPRNYFTGPGYHDWDTSLAKSFMVAERVKTEFRAQLYNVTNTPQRTLANQSLDTNPQDYPQVISYSANNPRNESYRQLELALRVSF